ncbi:MAG: MFS transporter [Thermoplasmata archaeon]|nr:MFS transporter [Thermoplasmata archaeon]MCI4353797.1 MFS transporter [Thermoplasmata archaeon]
MISLAEEGSGRRHRRAEDRRRIFLAKSTRAVAYGALSGFLFLYLSQDLGFSNVSSLLVTALTLVGAAGANLLLLPPLESRFGRRGALRGFALLFVASAALLYLSPDPILVVAAVLVGGVAASTADNGPLASLDQAMLPSTLRRADRPEGFARYNLLASFAGAGGALLLVVPGALTPRNVPFLPAAPHPWIGLVYLLLAGATLFAYTGLTEEVEPRTPMEARRTTPIAVERRSSVRALTALFGVDAFAGGMVINPLITSYFVLAWNQDAVSIGWILFVVGAVSGLSFLVASRLAARFGLLPTMVFTHLPSNVLLVLVPFMPTFPLALAVLVARSGLSQMDVPTRQAYTMEMVPDSERATVAGVLAGSRSVAQSVGPFPALALQTGGFLAAPFVIAGSLKTGYDLLLWRRFRGETLPPEGPAHPATASSASTPRD